MKAEKKTQEEPFNWKVFFIISSVYTIAGIYRNGFPALFPFIQREFNISRAQLGLQSTFLFTMSSFAAIFSGRIVDLKGSRVGLALGIFSMGLFVALHSIVPNFFFLLIAASLTGFGTSMVLPATSKSIISNFPPKKRSIAMGLNSSGGSLGGSFAAAVLPLIGNYMGWRKTVLIPGFLSMLVAAFILRFYKEPDPIPLPTTKVLEKRKIPFHKELLLLLKNFRLLIICITGFFLGSTSGITATHFTMYLYLDHGFVETIAGLGFSIVQVGSIIGRFGWGLVCDGLLGGNKRKTFLYLGLLYSIITLFIGFFGRVFPFPLIVFFVFAFLLGFSSRGWQALYYTAVFEAAGKERTGIAIGLSNIFVYGGLVLAPPLIGYIADQKGSYDFSWSLIGLILLFVSVGQFFVKKGEDTG